MERKASCCRVLIKASFSKFNDSPSNGFWLVTVSSIIAVDHKKEINNNSWKLFNNYSMEDSTARTDIIDLTSVSKSQFGCVLNFHLDILSCCRNCFPQYCRHWKWKINNNDIYYSFKIFRGFWSAYGPQLILHNQPDHWPNLEDVLSIWCILTWKWGW